MQPKVQLINMTKGAPMAFDNLLVEQFARKKPIKVYSVYERKREYRA